MGIHEAWNEPLMKPMQMPQDSPAAVATRYAHGLTRRLTTEKTERQTRLW